VSEHVVTVTPTIMDGTVVRWYRSLAAAESPAVCGIISASRTGVIGGGDLITPADWEAAWSVHEQLSRDQSADLDHLATHRRQSLMGPLVSVTS